MSFVEPSSSRGLGRAREFATAAYARDAARAGRGSVLAVTGTAGVGKTWLLESIAGVAAAEGFRVGWGASWLAGEAPALWPWQRAVAELGGELPAALVEHPPDTESAEWFRQCASVVEQLTEVTNDRPCMVVIDDAHAADEPTVRLAHFVARHVRGMHLVLVVAHQPSERLEAFDREATTIALHGLGPEDVAAVLADRGIDGCSERDIDFLVGATGGLPFEVHRIAASAPNAEGVVRTLIEQRVATLPPDIALGAAYAAVFDASPRLSHVAAITADKEIDALAIAYELERAGLATRQAPDGLTFTHEDVRATLAALVDADDVIEIHARAARLLAGGPRSVDRLERRAEHALAATRRSADDAQRAMQITGDAAAALIAANHPERAAELLSAAGKAREAAGLGRPPAALLAAHAEAVLRCGQLTRAHELFGRAATAAEEDDDATSLARAALGLGGVWLAEQRSPIERERILGLQRRALDGLPPEATALRLRLGARLAAELAYGTTHFAGIEAQVDAAPRVRRSGGARGRALAASPHRPRTGTPRHPSDHRPRDAVRRRGRQGQLVVAHGAPVVHGRPVPRREPTSGAIAARAARTRRGTCGKHAAYIASVMDVMLLQRAGRLDEAEAAAGAAFAVGTEVGDADAIAYFGSQIVALRWIQGRAAEVIELAAETAASPTITPANHAFTAVFASLAADCGERDRAHAALSRLRGRLDAIPQSSAWLATLFSTVEAAHSIGDVEIAREAADLLEPYADLPVLGSLAVVCLGSPRRSLGLAALTAGDLDRGIALLEVALVDNDRLGNRPLAALTAADLAQAHADRAHENDREIAVELLDRAIREADAMGLAVRAADWRTRRSGIFEGAPPRPEPQPEGTASITAPGSVVGARCRRARGRRARSARDELSRAAAHESQCRDPRRGARG